MLAISFLKIAFMPTDTMSFMFSRMSFSKIYSTKVFTIAFESATLANCSRNESGAAKYFSITQLKR